MAIEYKLPYTANDINERLRKVNEIDSLKSLVGTTPVSEQINAAIEDVKVETDETLKVSGSAADAKATGDAITNLNNLVGTTSVADQIAEAIVEVYVQDEAPEDAVEGSIWVDTDANGPSTTSGKITANVYVEDLRTTDMNTVDFSKYAVGDVVIITVS